jgi:hypothetical protein
MRRNKDLYLAASKKEEFSDLRSCAMKKRYKSEKGARMAVEMGDGAAGIRWYRCNRCLEWHTTHVPLYAFGEGS